MLCWLFLHYLCRLYVYTDVKVMQTLALVCMSIQNVDYGIIYCKFYTNWFHGTLWEICGGLVFWIIMLQPFLWDINLCQGQSHLATWSMCPRCSSVLSVSSVLSCVVMCCRVSHMSCCHFLTNDNPVLSWQLALTTPAPPEPSIYIFSTDDEPCSWTKGKVGSTFFIFQL